ncbi:hypothetical protein I553_8778 [Mycobacterium xenopi 4042]|uniref:Uncharacterized protein n=1 Tax=Mycobacterium xenopi 4042 TaxID=1299334 RepID=X8CKU7_MYCXE|nr:hypothetical protein I553_8778 [Mycobacterium xenopi 4042]
MPHDGVADVGHRAGQPPEAVEVSIATLTDKVFGHQRVAGLHEVMCMLA